MDIKEKIDQVEAVKEILNKHSPIFVWEYFIVAKEICQAFVVKLPKNPYLKEITCADEDGAIVTYQNPAYLSFADDMERVRQANLGIVFKEE